MDKKCKHNVVFLSTKVKPHIHACTKCKIYSPKKHPALSHEEILVLIEFASSMKTEFKKLKDKRKRDINRSSKIS